MSITQTGEKKDDTCEVRWAEGDSNSSYDVEATEFGIEINGSVIGWAWILRQLAKLEDKRQSP